MARPPNVRLDLLNRPENVLLVREALSGVAEAIDLDGPDLNDMRTAVTEACNNVVLHAYAGDEGAMEVEVQLGEGSVEVLVRDRGVGIRHSAAPEHGEPGLGVPVIEALSDTASFRELGAGHGTEVAMRFAAPDAHSMAPGLADGDAAAASAAALALDGSTAAGTALLSVAPNAIARSVVPRLLCVLAARAHFSTDRIFDMQLLGDALVAHAGPSLSGSYLQLAASVEPRRLELRVGPLLAGGGERLVLDSDVSGIGSVLERLADSRDVTSGDAHDTLTLQLLDRF
jgi:serine/threonine-protein kinase RsbW